MQKKRVDSGPYLVNLKMKIMSKKQSDMTSPSGIPSRSGPTTLPRRCGTADRIGWDWGSVWASLFGRSRFARITGFRTRKQDDE